GVLMWLQLVLHLHRFDNTTALACFHFGLSRSQHAHHSPRHGSHQFFRTTLVGRTALPAAQRTRIAQLDSKSLSPNPQMHVGGRALALDLVSLSIDQHRQNVAARQHGIETNLATIEPALPEAISSLQLQAVALAVDCDFVSHKTSG